MNCPKCNKPLRPGAKFCTACGQKIESAEACPECGAELRPGAKFCTRCGTKIASSQPSPEEAGAESSPSTTPKGGASGEVAPDVDNVQGRIYWNIQPGQVARVITEKEFAACSRIRGIIIAEGTTAYIRANGRTIATISGGAYDFEPTATSGSQGLGAALQRGWQVIADLFRSRKKKATDTPATSDELYERQQRDILDNARRGAAFSIVILLDKAFPLLVGARPDEGDEGCGFVPMTVRTRHLAVQMGVNAYFRIADHEAFIHHYLTGTAGIATTAIVREIADTVRTTMEETLADVELRETRLPKELCDTVKSRLNEVANETLFGLVIARIVEISAANDDLARFEALSRDLYLSETELDYLRRTNDFRNRLADVDNAQRLHDAASEVELRRQLDAINRDNLLREDELEKFQRLLANERAIREARSDDEREAALAEIERTGLIREEELEELRQLSATNQWRRGVALEMMQLRDGIEFERVRLEGEADKAEMIARRELGIQSLREQHDDDRFYADLDKQRAVADTQLDLEQRRRDMDYEDARRAHDLRRDDDEAQFNQFIAMQQAEEQARDNQRRHEAAVEQARQASAERMERMKWENAAHLSEEHVWALQGGEAAVAYAQNKYSTEAERAAAARLDQQRREDQARLDAERASRDTEHRETQAQMFQMMRDMMTMTSGINAQRADDRDRRTREQMEEKDRQLRERDERIRRQEGRMDTAYDRALDYTTRDGRPQAPPAAPPSPTPAAPPAAVTKAAATAPSRCPECGAELEAGAHFCPECGATV